MSEDSRDSTPSPPSRASTVPASRPPRRPEEERKLETVRRAIASVPPTRERGVLVVEDDPDLQWRLARMLTVRGNRVVGTSSAEAALELIRHWPVELVLVDDGLPGMSGMELARHIHENHPATSVVLMSSEPSAHSQLASHWASAVGAGVVAVLAKPFALESLLDLLRSLDNSEPELAPAE